jgi:Recombinase
MRGGGVMGWTPTPEQREALIRARDLTRMLRDGSVSWKLIADRLTADGYPTMRGGPWTYQMVQRLLRNPPPAGPSDDYGTRHWRVADRRGSARLLKCVHCADLGTGKQAYDWACLHGRDGVDPMDYIPLCRKCHIAYDGSGHHTPHTEESKAKMSKAVRRGLADGTRIGRYYPRRRPAEGQAAQHEEKRKQAGEPGEAA